MKRLSLIALLAIAGIWGCVPSIHGIATKENIVWDDGLLGRWGDPNEVGDPNAEVWQFEKGEKEGQYMLVYSDEKGIAGAFTVSLVQLDDMLFLDLFPANDTFEKLNVLSKVHTVPAHTFIKVDAIGEELQMRFMRHDRVKDLLKEQPELVKHETRGDDSRSDDDTHDAVILTAGSIELQEFLMNYADQIFGDKDGMHLKKI